MAVVVVFWPMLVFSTSQAALANPVGIRHIVVDIVDKRVYRAPSEPAETIEGARTACGNVIGYRLYDTETKRGKPRPVRMCDKCAKTKPRDMTAMIGISGAGASAFPTPAERIGQGSLLT